MDGLQRIGLWVLVAIAVLLVLFGVGDIIAGVQNDPGVPLGIVGMTPAQLEAEGPHAYRMYDLTLRGGGVSLAVVGLLMTAILLIPFRQGQRWAWWTMWVLPVWAITVGVAILFVGVAPGEALPPPLISGFVLGLLAAAILVVSAPRFFGDGAQSGVGEN
jgi:energy-converting hydrogenase Eha subunit A